MPIILGELDKPEQSRILEIRDLIDVLLNANEELKINDKEQLQDIIQMCKDVVELFDDIKTSYLILLNAQRRNSNIK